MLVRCVYIVVSECAEAGEPVMVEENDVKCPEGDLHRETAFAFLLLVCLRSISHVTIDRNAGMGLDWGRLSLYPFSCSALVVYFLSSVNSSDLLSPPLPPLLVPILRLHFSFAFSLPLFPPRLRPRPATREEIRLGIPIVRHQRERHT